MNNPITHDQAQALLALADTGTFAGAAARLHKRHTAILYSIKTLEESIGFAVIDRSGYRSRLTDRGRRMLPACRGLLAATHALHMQASELRTGWEPHVRVVFDGIVPVDPLLRAVRALTEERIPTRVDVRSDFLAGVETTFVETSADVMIAVVPPTLTHLLRVPLPALPASLVTHAGHPLARGRHTAAALAQHVLITVRDSDPRLDLPTSNTDMRSTIHLSDFAAKRSAIVAGLGFGWLPNAMIEAELRDKTLVKVRWEHPSTYAFLPAIYHRAHIGPAAQRLLAALRVKSR